MEFLNSMRDSGGHLSQCSKVFPQFDLVVELTIFSKVGKKADRTFGWHRRDP
jgi:hypothetical protein